jgi:hypothetical protein
VLLLGRLAVREREQVQEALALRLARLLQLPDDQGISGIPQLPLHPC